MVLSNNEKQKRYRKGIKSDMYTIMLDLNRIEGNMIVLNSVLRELCMEVRKLQGREVR